MTSARPSFIALSVALPELDTDSFVEDYARFFFGEPTKVTRLEANMENALFVRSWAARESPLAAIEVQHLSYMPWDGPQNALLKTVEEGLAGNKLLVLQSPEFLETVRSRAYNLRLGYLTALELAAVMRQEGYSEEDVELYCHLGSLSDVEYYKNPACPRAVRIVAALHRRNGQMLEKALEGDDLSQQTVQDIVAWVYDPLGAAPRPQRVENMRLACPDPLVKEALLAMDAIEVPARWRYRAALARLQDHDGRSR